MQWVVHQMTGKSTSGCATDKHCLSVKHAGQLADAEMLSLHGKDSPACRFGKWRERRSRVEKDVRRTDRAQAFYRKKSNVRQLQNVLLSYAMYNFDLGYVQACCKFTAFTLLEPPSR